MVGTDIVEVMNSVEVTGGKVRVPTISVGTVRVELQFTSAKMNIRLLQATYTTVVAVINVIVDNSVSVDTLLVGVR